MGKGNHAQNKSSVAIYAIPRNGQMDKQKFLNWLYNYIPMVENEIESQMSIDRMLYLEGELKLARTLLEKINSGDFDKENEPLF